MNRHHSALCLHEGALLSVDDFGNCGNRCLRLAIVSHLDGHNIAELGIVATGEIAVNGDLVPCKVGKPERFERIGD